MTSFGFGTTIAATYDQAVELTRTALKEQGFGVLTEIDVRQTLQEKLGADFRPYVILGACNPRSPIARSRPILASASSSPATWWSTTTATAHRELRRWTPARRSVLSATIWSWRR